MNFSFIDYLQVFFPVEKHPSIDLIIDFKP